MSDFLQDMNLGKIKREGGGLPPLFSKLGIIVLSLFLQPSNVRANCDIGSYSELLKQIKKNHPQIQLNNKSLELVKQTHEIAGQRPNPELELEGSGGETIEGNVTRASVSLGHVIEMGGKKASRLEVATRTIETTKHQLGLSDENVLIDSILRLHRLRQIYELIPVHKEAMQAFTKILNRMRKRKTLSPEEEVEKETLELATNDYKLKITQLISEQADLNRHLALFTGLNCDVPQKALPKAPKLEKTFDSYRSVENYSKLKFANDNLKLAESNFDLAKANSYPNLTIAPIYEYEKINLFQNHTFGVALKMDLPLFNTNSGGRAYAQSAVVKARKRLLNIKSESELDLTSWIKKYNGYKRALKGVATRGALKRKHDKIESLFRRGIISTTLVIESHRQLIEFSKTRLEFELGAVEALWKINQLIGGMNNENM